MTIGPTTTAGCPSLSPNPVTVNVQTAQLGQPDNPGSASFLTFRNSTTQGITIVGPAFVKLGPISPGEEQQLDIVGAFHTTITTTIAYGVVGCTDASGNDAYLGQISVIASHSAY